MDVICVESKCSKLRDIDTPRMSSWGLIQDPKSLKTAEKTRTISPIRRTEIDPDSQKDLAPNFSPKKTDNDLNCYLILFSIQPF